MYMYSGLLVVIDHLLYTLGYCLTSTVEEKQLGPGFKKPCLMSTSSGTGCASSEGNAAGGTCDLDGVGTVGICGLDGGTCGLYRGTCGLDGGTCGLDDCCALSSVCA